LAATWLRHFPAVFDDDDLRQTETQPTKHFIEWFTAAYIYQRFGLPSFVEKAQYRGSHARKREIMDRLMPIDTFRKLNNICDKCEVQWPDLLVYRTDLRRFWFAEAKGPGDSLSQKQRRSHRLIEKYLRTKVKLFDVRVGPANSADTLAPSNTR
jgi:hypothetical protein